MQQATGDDAVPGMVGATQTFGDLIHWHPHVHAIVSDGVFSHDGHFIDVSDVDLAVVKEMKPIVTMQKSAA